jgi:ABC-2 type transport system permease protein
MNPWELLKLESKRYLPNVTFRVIGVLYVIFFILVLCLVHSLGRNFTLPSRGAVSHPLAGIFAYPQDWGLLACIGSWMNIFLLGFLGVYMITMEFGNRTLRQSVIFGMTRLEVAVAKLLWSAALALAATGVYILLVYGAEVLDGRAMGLPLGGTILCFFLQALGYLCLGTLAGLLIRQTALAAMAYLGYVFILENVCRWVFYFSVSKTRLLMYLPNQVLGALTPVPVSDSVRQIVRATFTLPLSPSEAALSAVGYIVLFAVLFCQTIIKSDL